MASPSNVDVLIIGGFGHVGLPLGISLAHSGLQVLLNDLNQALRPVIEGGTMPFIEYGSEELLKKTIGKTLHVSDGLKDVTRAKTIIITIGTPVDEYLSPETRSLFALAEQLAPFVRDDHCIILRSTVYPGTTRALGEFFRARGKNPLLCNCPERIAQGYAIQELTKLPQIISGTTPEAAKKADELFKKMGVETIAIDPEEAECAKLFTNAWRYIQFAAANQFAMIARERGLDDKRIHHAMTHNYPRAKDLPRPGFAAGPCLFKDTMQLAASDRNRFLLGHAAMMVNEGLPAFVIQELKQKGIRLRGKTVGILGMAFKAEIDDTRDSLSFKLRKLLNFEGASVVCSDEYAKDDSFLSKEDLLKQSDIVIVGVPHKAYKTLKFGPKTHIVDLWGILQPA